MTASQQATFEFEDEHDFHVGDHVTDRENAHRQMVVTGIPPGITAEQYEISGMGQSVYEFNQENASRNYPPDDPVIEVKFVNKDLPYLDGQQKYAYPASRLELLHCVHGEDLDRARDIFVVRDSA